MDEELSIEEFLERKTDFSPFVVHLTRGDAEFYAKEVLSIILDEKTIKAYNHYCYFSPALNESQSVSLQDKFKVVCFTETPIGQIDVLLNKVIGRNFKPEPYGLVFKKEYIRKKGGNPVFYVTKEIARPLWQLYDEESSAEICKLLALVTVCEQGNDWHWEREWRIIGNLHFNMGDIFCGLCPEEDILYFKNNYPQVKFISPNWGINKILRELMEKKG